MKALIVIDFTHDFVAEDGALTTGKYGQLIEAELFRLTQYFVDNGDYVVLAVDDHTLNDKQHPEHTLFPPHNITMSHGQKFYGDLQKLYWHNKHNDSVYFLPKKYYSAFQKNDLDIKLRRNRITQLHLCGVCTDVCILHTAIDAYNLGYSTVVYENATASLDRDNHHWAINHMRNILGAKITTTHESIPQAITQRQPPLLPS